jgi:hypothetical protein
MEEMEESLTRRPLPVRVLLLALVACAVLAGTLVLPADRALAAGGEPVVSEVSATNITEDGAILEAQVNPEGSATTYEVWVGCENPPPGSSTCEAIEESPQGQGNLVAGSEAQPVSINLTDLQPGASYWYVIVASSAAGRAESHHRPLTTQPAGACDGACPPKTEISEQAEESARISAEENPAREAEREQVAREQAEREAAVTRAGQPSTTITPAKTGSSAPATGGVALADTSIAVESNGIALVRLNCLGIAGCHGKLTLTVHGTKAQGTGKAQDMSKASATGKAKGKKQPHAVTLGTVSFSISGDEAKTVKLELNATGRALLGSDHGHLSASLAILELAPGPKNTQTKAARLVERKATTERK